MNLYAYCGNNPVSNVDPSGYSSDGIIINVIIGDSGGSATIDINVNSDGSYSTSTSVSGNCSVTVSSYSGSNSRNTADLLAANDNYDCFNLVDVAYACGRDFCDTWNDPATAKAGIQTVGTVAIVVPATVGGALGSGAALGYGGDIMLIGSKVYNQGMKYIYMNAVPLTEKTIILIDLFGPDK